MCGNKKSVKKQTHNNRTYRGHTNRKGLTKRGRTVQIIVRGSIVLGMILFFAFKGGLIQKWRTGVQKEDVYVGEREIDIMQIMNKDEKIKLPMFAWHLDVTEKTMEVKKEQYRTNVMEVVDRKDVRESASEEMLSSEDKVIWNELFVQIQKEEQKKENETTDVRDNITLTENEYWQNCCKRQAAYFLLPQSGMLGQYSRNAADALTVSLRKGGTEENRESDLVYGQTAVEGYIGLFGYVDCSHTKADICYWLADIYVQYWTHAEYLTEEEIEHCALMAYTFSEIGIEFAKEEQGVQHTHELIEVNNLMNSML